MNGDSDREVERSTEGKVTYWSVVHAVRVACVRTNTGPRGRHVFASLSY